MKIKRVKLEKFTFSHKILSNILFSSYFLLYLIQNEVSQGILKNCVTRSVSICVFGGAQVDENARIDEKPLIIVKSAKALVVIKRLSRGLVILVLDCLF